MLSRELWDKFVAMQESLFEQGCDAGIHPILYADRVIRAAEEYLEDSLCCCDEYDNEHANCPGTKLRDALEDRE